MRSLVARRAVVAAATATLAALVVGSAAGRPVEEGTRAGLPSPLPRAHAVVSDDVLTALERHERTPVLVTLSSARRLSSGSRADRREIAAHRRRALSATDPEDVTLGMAYTSVPAFSALVTRDGLRELLGSPAVLAVDVPRKMRPMLAEGVHLVRADLAHAAGVTGRV